MNDLVRKENTNLLEPAEQGTSLFHYSAQQTHVRLAEIEGKIAQWRRLKDWPKLLEAVEAKITEQKAFVSDWHDWVVPVNQSHRLAGAISPSKQVSKRLSQKQAEALTGFSQQRVSEFRKWTSPANIDAYRERLILGSHRLAGLASTENHRANGTGENEWFTPVEHIEAAREVMGGIDLDPASHPEAQKVVQANQYFTREQDGLGEDWFGRVWLNPPYTQPDIALFVHKLVEEVKWNRIEQALLLTHNYTDTEWFHEAESMATLICFTRGRINFVKLDGTLANPTQGQAIFYYGKNIEQFGYVFQNFGFIR